VATFQKQHFTEEKLAIDGNRYEACIFTNCELVYAGGDLPVFANCTFPGSKIQLGGAAFATVEYLKRLNAAGARSSVDKLIQSIETGTLTDSQRPAPPPASHTGNNYGQLGIIVGVLGVGTLLLLLGIWYSYLVFPYTELLDAEPPQPLAVEYPLNGMPALPDSLAEAYDETDLAQSTQLNGYTVVDEETGVVNIPIEDAFNILLNEGVAPLATEEVETNGSN
jgi:hypothetical protein